MSNRAMIHVEKTGNCTTKCGKVIDVDIGRKDGRAHYLSYAEIADIIGVSASTLRSYYSTNRMPRPDATIGTTPGWTESTIQTWMQNRPGPGARTDLRKKEDEG